MDEKQHRLARTSFFEVPYIVIQV